MPREQGATAASRDQAHRWEGPSWRGRQTWKADRHPGRGPNWPARRALPEQLCQPSSTHTEAEPPSQETWGGAEPSFLGPRTGVLNTLSSDVAMSPWTLRRMRAGAWGGPPQGPAGILIHDAPAQGGYSTGFHYLDVRSGFALVKLVDQRKIIHGQAA